MAIIEFDLSLAGCVALVAYFRLFSAEIIILPFIGFHVSQLQRTVNMHFPTALTRQKSSDFFGPRKTTPWIASPLAQGAYEHGSEHGETKSHIAERVIEFEESQHDLHRSRTDHGEPVFREHHESSTVELFYDLFFVANLATFTANHEIVDTASLKNYLGFFTLLWFTWLQYSLFDVRFSTGKRICSYSILGSSPCLATCRVCLPDLIGTH